LFQNIATIIAISYRLGAVTAPRHKLSSCLAYLNSETPDVILMDTNLRKNRVLSYAKCNE